MQTRNHLDKLLKYDLASFIAMTFQTVTPGVKYLHNWHIELIADRLEKCSRGQIKRLIINMPPRYLKSICVSVAWPAWLLGREPSIKIMAASYSQTLSLKHSIDTRLVMQSPWYKRIFPNTIITDDQNEKFKFVTTKRGFRFATSVGGTATGEGGDILIVDDPHNPMQAASHVQREVALDWFDQTFSTRLNDKKNGVIVVVMQRLHMEDLTGHLLAKNSRWEVLNLPAIAEKNEKFQINKLNGIIDFTREYKRNRGELLHTAREGIDEISLMKEELGSYGFAAQYQQNPILLDGNMVKLKWFKRYSESVLGDVVQSWDTAIKAGDSNDYSVCTTWIEKDGLHYLIDVLEIKVEYPELKRIIESHSARWKAKVVLIEDKASGQSLLQDLSKIESLALIPIMPKDDKICRFAAISAMIEAGKVYLPQNSSWLAAFEAQISAFPKGKHDDMVDSFTQYLAWIRGRDNFAPRMRKI